MQRPKELGSDAFSALAVGECDSMS